jgi:hypothetical protein
VCGRHLEGQAFCGLAVDREIEIKACVRSYAFNPETAMSRIAPKAKPTTPRAENTKTCQPFPVFAIEEGKASYL